MAEELPVLAAAEPEAKPEQPTTVRYQTLAWLATASALAYLTRNSIGVAEGKIREELGLTLAQSGYFMGCLLYTSDAADEL